MKVKMYSSVLTAIALLFVSPVLSTHAQEKISLSHAANTSVQDKNINSQKNNDLKDLFDSVVELFNPDKTPVPQSLPSQSQARAVSNACSTAVGYWWWDTRRFPVSIYVNGRILADDPASGGRIKASWRCVDPAKGTVEIRWSTGAVDLMQVVDKNTMMGDNGTHEVNAVRR